MDFTFRIAVPAVFPILLYNGDAKWTAPVKIEEKIEQSIPKEFIPRFQYFPILINEIPKKTLMRVQNALSAVFYIENLKPDELNKELDNFFKVIQNEDIEVVNVLSAWFNNYLESIEKRDKEFTIDEQEVKYRFDQIMEVKNMFATTMKEHDEKLRQETKEEDAKRMLKEELDIGLISRVTGLSKEEIEKLKK